MKQILWKRVLDVNDRSLHATSLLVRSAFTDGFTNTVRFLILRLASGDLAALCLVDSEQDLPSSIE